MRSEITYEDKDVIVIYKPAGLATQTAKVGQPDVVSELKKHLAAETARRPAPPYLGIVHRLDQPVEGLLVFAKHKKAAAELTRQLRGQGTEGENLLNKQYYAVCCGKPLKAEGQLVDYLAKTAEGKAAVVPEDAPGAKRAVLHYKVLGTASAEDGAQVFLADVRIDTGRFHQIRAQMAHAGMALLGDVKYGGGAATELSRRLGVRTVALCAYRLSLRHPVSGETLTFTVRPRGSVFSRFDRLPT